MRHSETEQIVQSEDFVELPSTTDLLRAHCTEEADCWTFPLTGQFRCRGPKDIRPHDQLPRYTPQTWAWMLANGRNAAPLPERVGVQHRQVVAEERDVTPHARSVDQCCNPEHLQLAGPGGIEIRLHDVDRLESSDHATALVVWGTLEDVKRLCTENEHGCWILSNPSPLPCRAMGDKRPIENLPQMQLHRWAWMVANHMAHRAISGTVIDIRHWCESKNCCNPRHLFPTNQFGKEISADEAERLSTFQPEDEGSVDINGSSPSEQITEINPAEGLRSQEDSRRLRTAPIGGSLPNSDSISWLTDFLSSKVVPQRISNADSSTEPVDTENMNGTEPLLVPEISEYADSSSSEEPSHPRVLATTFQSQQAVPSGTTDTSVLIEEHTRRIGTVFPLLNTDSTVIMPHAALDNRSANVLIRMKCFSWTDLADRTVGNLWDIPNSGRLTVTRILSAAALRNGELEQVEQNAFGEVGQSSEISKEFPWPGADLIDRKLWAFLSALIPWAIRERQASTLGDLLHLSPSLEYIPTELHEHWSDIGSFQLMNLVNPEIIDLPHDLAAQFVKDLGPSADLFVARKVHRGQIPTLEALAIPRGVTRERVRQLVKQCSVRADQLQHSETYRQLLWRADDLAQALGNACMCESDGAKSALETAASGLVDPDGCTASELMLWLAGPFSTSEGWYVLDGKNISDFRSEFEGKIGDGAVVTFDAARKMLQGLGMKSDDDEAVRNVLAGWRDIGDGSLVRWSGGLGDKAETVLSLMLSRTTVEDINDAIDEGNAISTLRNVLSADNRFVRLDRANHFGLRIWGWEEYSGIAQEIRERIERKGGVAELVDVIAELVGEFGVSESSVRTYSGAPMFVVENGNIRMRTELDSFVVGGRIASVRGLYLDNEGSALFHSVVDREMLRGSGRPLPEAASGALGLNPGDRFQLSDPATGTQLTVSWPLSSATGPSLGSLKSAVIDGGFHDGDQIRIRLSRTKGQFQIESVVSGSLFGLTGVDTRPGSEVQDLAIAMACDAGEVRSCLQSRGDSEVLLLLPVMKQRDDLGAALAEFGDLLG